MTNLVDDSRNIFACSYGGGRHNYPVANLEFKVIHCLEFRDDVRFSDASIPDVALAFDVVDLSKSTAQGIGNTPGANNRTEEKPHDVADMESTGAGRETEVSPLRRFRAVKDNLIDCRTEREVGHSTS